MADKKFSQLGAAVVPAAADTVPGLHNGGNVLFTAQSIADLYRRGIEYTHPQGSFFGSTGAVIAQTASQISGDPFIVWSGSQYVMYYFSSVSDGAYVRCYYRTAATLENAWSAPTELPNLAGYHKFVLLVNERGEPVQVGGQYHGYATFFSGAATSKEIFHFTSAALTGPWTLGSKVLPKGSAGSLDDYFTDTPYAVYTNNTIYLWYMGAPSAAQSDFGLAIRMLRATAAAPDGPFTKNYTDVLAPAAAASWEYGWLGGTQVRQQADGTWVLLYNAGNTRPTTAGTESGSSAIGMAYAASIDGPWSRDINNPYMEVTGTPSDALEQVNCWRGHLAWDKLLKKWFLYYNTGNGTETITYARQGVYDYFYLSQGNPYNVQSITTAVVSITNSRVNLPAGEYRVRGAINVIGDSSGTLPKLDVDTSLRINGVTYKVAARDFVGSYAYENRDFVVEHAISLSTRGYIDLAIQATNGAPLSTTWARRLRMLVTQLR